MAVLKRFFSSLKKLFRKKKQRQRIKRRVRKKSLSPRRAPRKSPGKSPPARLSREKIKKKRSVSSSKKSLRPVSASALPVSPLKSSLAKTPPSGQAVGVVTHFFSKIQVVVVKMEKGNLAVGNKVRIHGKVTDFTQTVRSMQIESVNVRSARRGQLIGLKVEREARVGDRVYKLVVQAGLTRGEKYCIIAVSAHEYDPTQIRATSKDSGG